MSRFAEAKQGIGARLPKTIRPAFLLIGAGIAYSQCFYAPQMRLDPVRVAATSRDCERITVTSVRGANGPAAEQRLTEFMKLLIEIGLKRYRKDERNDIAPDSGNGRPRESGEAG